MSQIIFGDMGNKVQPDTTARMGFPVGACDFMSTTSTDLFIMPCAGKITNFKVKQDTAPAANGHVWSLQIYAGAYLVATVAVGQTEAEAIGSIDMVQGDLVYINVATSSGTGTLVDAWISWVFTPTTANQTILGGTSPISLTTSTVYAGFAGFHDVYSTTEAPVQTIITAPGTLKELSIQLATLAGAGKSRTFTVFKNGIATALVATVAGASDSYGYDHVNTVAVVAGDTISLRCVATGGPPDSIVRYSVVLETTNKNEFVVPMVTNTNFSATAVRYCPPWRGTTPPLTAELGTQALGQRGIHVVKFKKVYVKMRGGIPDGGVTAWNITLRKNVTDTALAVAVEDGADSSGNAAADVEVSDGDLWSTKIAPVAGVAIAQPGNISYLCEMTHFATVHVKGAAILGATIL